MAGLTETPEFKAAVAAARDAIKADLQADLKRALAAAAPAEEAGATSLFQQLALAIAEISDQGTSRKRVAPEILAERSAARERMGALIMKAREQGLAPEYRLIAKVYFHERLVEPFQRGVGGRMVPTEVIWDGVPNEAMRPMNEAAAAIFDEFLKSIGGSPDVTGISEQPVWVTAGGVVVKAPPTATAMAHGLTNVPEAGNTSPAAPSGFEGRFAVKRQDDPNAPEIHVLGTVAAPARQNAPGKAA